MDFEKERGRIHALYNLAALDSEQEAEFDNIVQLASQICQTPVSFISLIDYDRQWFKAAKGYNKKETERSVSFCSNAILQEGAMVIKDATLDNRFAANPLVTADPSFRFYAGVPLVTQAGHAMGTLCVIDKQARELSQEQLFGLKVLGQQIISQLELQAKIKRLNALNDSKDRILSVIAHDVKGPLANIRQTFNLLEQGLISAEDIKGLSGKILRNLDKSDRLLGELIRWFLSQVEEEGTPYVQLNLVDLLQEIAAEISEQTAKKKNRLSITSAPAVLISGNRNMLKFIVRNLLVNANKYTENGTITVRLTETEKDVTVSVKDSGVGIEKESLKKLLSREKSKVRPGTANEQGHGLGLLLAQDFAGKHNGRIEIDSEEGSGTEVQVILPKRLF